MLCFKNKVSSFLILTTLILVFFSLFASSGLAGATQNDVVPRGTQRPVSEGSNSSDLVLARERTRRQDPLENRSYYNGGWNISNEHYIFSVFYTGYPLFLTATLWFILFGIFLLLACMYVCCCRRRRYGYSKFAYALSLIFLSLFTIAAIIGSAVLYTGQGKFHESTKSTLDFVLQQADSTVENLQNVSGYLTAAKNVRVNHVFLPRQVQTNIDNVNGMITTAANTLESATKNNKDDIFRYLDAVSLVLIVVAAVMLGLDLLGFLLSITGLQFLVYFLVFFGWILVAITFFLCGIFLVLHNATGDTCVAMHEWVDNPTAHTALDRIIPCVDPTTSQEARSQSKEVTIQMVQLVNGIITNVSNRNFPPNSGPLYYNQSGPLVPLLCNPYNLCPAGEVDLNNATQVYRNYECRVSQSNICTTVGRLTPSLYDEVGRALNVSYGLYHYGPFLSDLADCTFVRDTFTAIYERHCPGLRRYSQWVYIGLVMVSTAVLLSLIFWVVYARERRHRKYTKLVDGHVSSGVR
ncbi:cardiolipin synthase [Striga asiatica]|uniref:Cardiolipin synthase n=1 Tax=Striga asiatica TaxID=4170 RepID=A0A5A7QFK5_STRAF|nr:cardiolipin synthase [Striga asiatica]